MNIRRKVTGLYYEVRGCVQWNFDLMKGQGTDKICLRKKVFLYQGSFSYKLFCYLLG